MPPPPVTVLLDHKDDAAGEIYLAHDLLAARGNPPLLPGQFTPGTDLPSGPR
ncbi:hypothetical protein [Streptomyces sp. WAC 01325]|uniref:hypothetical protein n=1 Tax=Streptomyces sp. WAC 01325 TaxID=2203202 RepID=UPI00163CD43E|nr:hypothetical protein [Streptomyces sp. WAC 01325]